ncbi:MAG: tetratricopeptide repeat protein [Kofleriaceae bacterium]
MGISRAVAAVVIASAAIAHAQPKPSPQQLQQAGDLVKKAIARSQTGDHVLAIELYEQAYNIIPQPILLSNIGSEYQQAQQPADAVKYFCQYLAADPDGAGVTFATTQVRSMQITLGNDVEGRDVCHPKAKPAPEPPPPTESLTGTSFAPTGGPAAEEPSHPGLAWEITGATVMVASAVPLVIGVGYWYKSYSLNSQIVGHQGGDPWPTQIDGIAIKDWPTEGLRFNHDARVFTIPGAIGVLIGGGVLLYGIHASHASPAAEHARLVPTASAHDAGLALVGAF